MKLFLQVAFLSVLMAVPSFAARSFQGSRGQDVTIEHIGALVCDIDVTTGTTQVICGSTNPKDSNLSRSGIVYAVIASSIQITNYLIFRDTDTGNTTSSSHTLIYANETSLTAATELRNVEKSVYIKLPVPIFFQNGIGVNSADAPADEGRWSILYRIFDK